MELNVKGRWSGLESVFRRSLAAARIVMKRRSRLMRMVQRAYVRTARHGSGWGQFKHDLVALLRFVRAWATGRYRNVPWKSALYAVAAVIYFLNPIDLIPDKLIAIGFVDDAAVVAAVLRMIQNDLRSFQRWEAEQDSVKVPERIEKRAA